MLYHLSKLNPEDKNNSNGPIVSNDIKAVIKSLPCNKRKKKKKAQNQMDSLFTTEIYQPFKEDLISILPTLFYKTEQEG